MGTLKVTKVPFALTYLGQFQNDLYHGQGQLKIDPITHFQSEIVFHSKRLLYNGNFADGKREGKGEMYWNPKKDEQSEAEYPEESKNDSEDFGAFRVHSFSSSPFRRAKYVFHYDGGWKDDMMNGEGNLYMMKTESVSLSGEKRAKGKHRETEDVDNDGDDRPDQFIGVYGIWKNNQLEKRLNKDIPDGEGTQMNEIEIM